ncbi:MAG: hypothetical protein Q4F65_07310 [Propionibacteriaceae bacterium]|nr:hypothetical protein [Propionibacteriaceae bacterium]
MKRTLLATVAAAAVLATTACTGDAGSGTPAPAPSASVQPSATPLPSASPLPTASATPTAQPSPANPGVTTQPTGTPPPRRSDATPTTQATPELPSDIPGDLGHVPDGFLLPDENRPATDETSAFATTVWRPSCPDRVLTLESTKGLSGTRIKESIGPEQATTNGLLVFDDEAAAQAFMTELGTQLRGCVTEGPDEDGWRNLQATRDVTDLADGGFSVGGWSQWNTDDGYVDAPGGGLELVVRKGAYVALAHEGGEYVGDPATLDELVTRVRAQITAILDQV